MTRALLETMETPNPDHVPNMTWFKTIKGRGYGVTGYKSHGTPHKLNSEIFWQGRQEFADKYGVDLGGLRRGRAVRCRRAARAVRGEPEGDRGHDHERRRAGGLHGGPAGRTGRFGAGGDPRLQTRHVQEPLRRTSGSGTSRTTRTTSGRKPGANAANRAGFAKWGAYVNSLGRQALWPAALPRHVRRPRGVDQHRRLRRRATATCPAGAGTTATSNQDGALLPQEITEFTNSGVSAGIATVNFSPDAVRELRRLLRGALDLRLLLLPEVRPDAPLQPARAGLGHQGRQGALGRRPLRPGDGRGLAHALRHLLAGRDATLPGGARHQPHPVGVQRGAGDARRGLRDRRADRRRCT